MSDMGVLVTLDEEQFKNRSLLDYTSRDFGAIRAQLIGLAKGIMPEWETAGESSDFGTLLIELFAYLGDTLNYYIDRTASEAFLSTAIRPQSVLYLADMLGYNPVGQSAASVPITITAYTPAPEDPMDDIKIPAGLRVHSEASNADSVVIFETTVPVVMKPGEVKTVIAEEGLTVVDYPLGTAFGVPNTEFTLPDRGVISGSIRVVSIEGYDSIQWNYTSDLSSSRPTQAAFTTYIDDQNLTHIVFGDNTSGRIPSVNARLFANYRYGVGAAANSVAIDDIQTFIAPADFDAWKITITNEEQPRGGADVESVTSMKYNIPRAGVRIHGRAVTLGDYADLALQVAGVSKSVAEGTVYTAVKVYIGPTSGDISDETMGRLRTSVSAFMSDKILIGSQVIILPETTEELWLDVYLRVTIHVADVYNRTSVREQVENVLNRVFSYDLMDFGSRISLGAVYRAVLTVAGVEWAEIRWMSVNKPSDVVPPPAIGTTGVEEGLPTTTTQSLLETTWKWENLTTPAEPTGTTYRILDDGGSADTSLWIMYLSNTDNTPPAAGSANRITDLAKLQIGDHVLISTIGDGAAWWDYIIHEAPVAHAPSGAPLTPGFSDMKVRLSRSSISPAPPSNQEEVYFQILRYSPSPVSVTEVGDIITPEINIPRIEPTSVIEETDAWIATGMTEEERTHDGLWVTAYGGLANS